MAKKSKNWIQKAIKHPGAFKQWAKANHYSMSEAIQIGKHSKNPTIKKRAVLAETLKKLSKRRKKK